jgi:hypothetical protein
VGSWFRGGLVQGMVLRSKRRSFALESSLRIRLANLVEVRPEGSCPDGPGALRKIPGPSGDGPSGFTFLMLEGSLQSG